MRIPATAAAVLAAALLAGCSAAENVADDAAQAAKDRAQQEASQAARNALEDQICALVGDGRVTDTEIESVSRLIDGAAVAGVPQDVLAPARALVDDGEATASRVAELQEACPQS